jgi:RNAse (barnase) inhibitor barstar
MSSERFSSNTPLTLDAQHGQAVGEVLSAAGESPVSQAKEGSIMLRQVRPNIVQSIRAFRVEQLQVAAADMGQHFLYANLSATSTKQEVLEAIAEQFTFPKHFGKNFDALHDCLTDMVYKAGAQPGFIVVLEHIPQAGKFDREARETLLDVFRDAADFWSEKHVQFRCFYSFQ